MPSASTQKAAARPLRVIYAEDLRELRELMRLVLARDGHALESFPDASDALVRLDAAIDQFDLVITDHHMPVMNGLDFVRHLRRLPFAGKIIVFSSELSPEVRDDYLALKVDHVLAKPVRPAELRGLLAEMFPAHTPEPA